MSEYDVIIVGARCGGAAQALLLARRGLRVLVLDRTRRGSDKLSTLYIHQTGVARLRSWGVLPAVESTGAPAINGLSYRVQGLHITAPGPWVGGGNSAYAPRRSDLDDILCAAAEDAGAVVRHECSVNGLLHDDTGRVIGVQYRSRGTGHEASARLVIGADGLRSTIAEAVGARSYIRHDRLSCCYYTFYQDLPHGFEQHEAEGHWVGVIPTRDDQRLVACYFQQSEFPRVRADAEASYLACLDTTAPEVAAHARTAQRAGRLMGMGDQQNYFKTACGPGWALVGDAGHHKDSLTARGITDAFTQAELLDAAIARAGSLEPQHLDPSLERFGQERDEALLPFYYSTLNVARLTISPQRIQDLEAVADSANRSAAYAAAVAGALTPAEYQEMSTTQQQGVA